MSDYLVRATAMGGRVRAFALNATGVVDELRERHSMHPVPTAAVGRSAMGALLLAAASLKKEDQILTLEVRGNGPIGRIICTADGAGGVRGLAANPYVHAPSRAPGKLNVGGVVGASGYQHNAIKLGFIGVFVVHDGSVEAAGGFLLQLLPELDTREIAGIEEGVAALPHPTTLIREGVTPEEMLGRIFPAGFEMLDSYPVAFACPCSRERFEAALITLGPDELAKIIKEEENEFTELVCHFCNEAYHFAASDMEEILRAAS